MELRNFIDQGVKKAGTLTALGREIGLSQPEISNVKAGKRSLPAYAAVGLADYLNVDVRTIIAASELITEKDERKRNYWIETLAAKTAKAACITLIVTGASTTPLIEQAQAAEPTPNQFVLC